MRGCPVKTIDPGPDENADLLSPDTATRALIRISEITVRMSDGASHRFTDENLSNWQPGERVMIIQGSGADDD